MPITSREFQGARVLDLMGRFDSSARQDVQSALNDALEAGAHHVIFNLAGVPFIDSAAMGLLALNHQKFRQAGGRISLVNPQPEVRLLLDMAATPKLIPSYRTLEEAVATSSEATE